MELHHLKGHSKLFLSYSRKDLKFAQMIHDALQVEGFEVLLDRTDIAPGEDWKARLGQLIHEADAVVFVLSPHSAASAVCAWEIGEAERLGKRILPALITKVADTLVPPALGRLNFISFVKRDFDTAIVDIMAALNTNLVWVREHTRLSELAAVWDVKGQNTGQVLRGAALSDAENWLASAPTDAALPTDLQRGFIAASRSAATGRQRNWVAGSVAVAIVSAGLAIWGEVNRRTAVEQKDRAEKVLAAATVTSHSLVYDLAQDFRNVEGVPITTIRRVLEKARGLQKELGKAGGATFDMRRDEAAALNELATTYRDQGATEDALVAALESMAIIEKLVVEDPTNDKWKRYLSVSGDSVADILVLQGKTDEAMALFVKGKNIAKTLWEIEPKSSEKILDYSVSLDRIGDQQSYMRDYVGALESFTESKRLREGIKVHDSEYKSAQLGLAVAQAKRGEALDALNRNVEAFAEFNAAMKILDGLILGDASNLEYKRDKFVFSFDLADNMATRGDNAGAIAIYNQAIAMAQSLASTDPQNNQWQRDQAYAQYKAASFQLDLGVLGASEAYLQASLAAYEKLTLSDTKNQGWVREKAEVLFTSGNLLVKKGNIPEAIKAYDQAIDIIRKFRADKPDNENYENALPRFLDELAVAQSLNGSREMAIASQIESLNLRRKLLAKHPLEDGAKVNLLVSLYQLGDAQLANGETKSAETNYNEAILIAEKMLDQMPTNANRKLNVAAGLVKIGDVKFDLRDGPAAYANYDRARKIYLELQDADGTDVKVALNLVLLNMNIGALLIATNEKPTAVAYLHAAIDTLDALIAQDLENAELKRYQIEIFKKLGDAGETPKDNFNSALKIAEAMKAKGQMMAFADHKISELLSLLAKLPK